jgi:hypothetical protein
MKARVQEHAMRPAPVEGVHRGKETHVKLFDPAFELRVTLLIRTELFSPVRSNVSARSMLSPYLMKLSISLTVTIKNSWPGCSSETANSDP